MENFVLQGNNIFNPNSSRLFSSHIKTQSSQLNTETKIQTSTTRPFTAAFKPKKKSTISTPKLSRYLSSPEETLESFNRNYIENYDWKRLFENKSNTGKIRFSFGSGTYGSRYPTNLYPDINQKENSDLTPKNSIKLSKSVKTFVKPTIESQLMDIESIHPINRVEKEKNIFSFNENRNIRSSYKMFEQMEADKKEIKTKLSTNVFFKNQNKFKSEIKDILYSIASTKETRSHRTESNIFLSEKIFKRPKKIFTSKRKITSIARKKGAKFFK